MRRALLLNFLTALTVLSVCNAQTPEPEPSGPAFFTLGTVYYVKAPVFLATSRYDAWRLLHYTALDDTEALERMASAGDICWLDHTIKVELLAVISAGSNDNSPRIAEVRPFGSRYACWVRYEALVEPYATSPLPATGVHANRRQP